MTECCFSVTTYTHYRKVYSLIDLHAKSNFTQNHLLKLNADDYFNHEIQDTTYQLF